MRAAVAVTDTRRGGTPIRMASVARALRKRGWEILFVSVLPAGPVLEDLSMDGIATASLNLSSPGGAPVAVRRLRGLLGSWRPDVLQTALWHANLLGRLAAWGTGIPVISGYQSLDDDKSLLRVLADRATSRLAAAHVCVSRAVADRLESRERIPRADITVIPLGKEIGKWASQGRRDDVRKSLRLPLDARVVGWVGRIHPVKDLPTLVKAVGLIPEWWLLIVGDGQADRISEWAAQQDLRKRILTVGETSDVAPLLEAMDIFCLVSLWEGFPGALVEAMAAGLPVVATNVGGIPEIVTHGHDGLLVPPNSPETVARAIVEAAGRPDLGHRAAETVRRRFSEETMADAYEQLWWRLASPG